MKQLKLLAGTTALAGALGLMVMANAADAQTANTSHCIDTYCHMQSLESFDGIIPADTDSVAGSDEPSTKATHYGTWGIDLTGMDTSVKPGDSFYNFVNGTATKNMVIPADKTSFGSFVALRDLSEARSKAILMSLVANPKLTGDDTKIAAVYKSMMDEAHIESLDFKPIQAGLNAIDAIKTKAQMAAFMGTGQFSWGTAVFGMGIGADDKNPDYNVLSLGQAGLSLPDRDYYLKPNYADKKAKYELYVADMLGKVGYPDAAKHAHDIVAMETAIAEASWTRIERRDTSKTYNPMKLSDMPAYAPGFDWAVFFKAARVSGAKKIVVAEKSAIPKIAKIYADTSLETLKAWEAFRVIDATAPDLSKRFVDAQWQFRSHELSGALAQQPRWKRGISLTSNLLGEALGRDYVGAYFPAESKAKMVALVADLRAALKVRIENLTWMTPETKEKAILKLSQYTVKIGYPDKWQDYSKFNPIATDLVGNLQKSSIYQWNRDLAKLDKPVDKTEWGMTPQTVNAYYNPTANEIVFPAAILQPPFFDPGADPAVNYGGIGGVIGHEITHGFDDQGRHYDGKGYLKDWWTAEDSEKFDAQAKKYGEQYDTYEPVPGYHVQGGLTMGENIADLGGNLLGLDAYHLSLKGAESPVLDGFTGDQRVFMGFAQVWRSKYRDEAVKLQVTTDPHSPAVFRVIGPVRNIDAWYKAFNVQPGEKYYLAPEDRVRIW